MATLLMVWINQADIKSAGCCTSRRNSGEAYRRSRANLNIFLIAVAAHLLSHGIAPAAEIRIIDGDRFVMPDGEVVRVENIRTPSIDNGADCLLERQTGQKTVARVKQLFADCPPVLDRRFRDKKGRTEARVEVCGDDLGEVLISERLAIFRDAPKNWCDSPPQ